MHIEKLEIKGFGRVSNLSLKFNRGLNIIYGQNEAGKSTIQWFVKGMFYGLKGGRTTRDGEMPPLRKFKPWRGVDFGGTMEYSLESGDIFRIERNFDNNLLKIYDSFFNDITDTFPVAKGKGVQFAERHLGLTESCFERTAFIRQMDTRIDADGNKELISRLANISETGFEDVSFRKAEKALKDAIRNYIGTERTSIRPLDKINQRIRELTETRISLIDKRNLVLSVEKDLEKVLAIEEKIDFKKLVLLKVREAVEIKKRIEKGRRQESGLKEVFNDICSAEQEITEAKFQLEQSSGKENRLLQLDENKRVKVLIFKKKLAGLCAVASLVCAAFFSVFGMIKNSSAFAAATVALLAAAISLFARAKVSRGLLIFLEKRDKLLKSDDNSLEDIISLNNDLKDMYSRASLLYGNYISNSSQIGEAVNEISMGLSSLNERLSVYINEIENFDSCPDFLLKVIERFNHRLSEAELKELETICETMDSEFDEESREVLLKIKEYETLLVSMSVDNDEMQRVDEEIAELEYKKQQLEDTGYSLKTALELMTAASMEIRKDFIPAINNNMSSIISRITEGRYSEVRADDNLYLKAVTPEMGEVASALSLSGGTIDQMYLALRIASADLLSPAGEKLPIILDESFAQYDDIRTRESLVLLDELAESRQVIIFTCKSREVDIAMEVCKDDFNLISLH